MSTEEYQKLGISIREIQKFLKKQKKGFSMGGLKNTFAHYQDVEGIIELMIAANLAFDVWRGDTQFIFLS